MIKLGITLTTNNPELTFESFLPTLPNICELIDRSVFLINFQPPWTRNSITEAVSQIKDFGFDIRWTFTSGWTKPIKLIEMRRISFDLGEDCDVFMICDDDFKFSPGTVTQFKTSGQKYLDCLDYMERHPRCGVINVKGFFGGSRWGEKISPVWKDMFATNRGMFLRKMKKFNFTPKDTWNLRGGLEESIAVYSRVALGFFPAKQMNNPTIHHPERVDNETLPKHDMHNPSLINENAAKYIRERYGQRNWTYDSRRLPYLVPIEYKKNGGVPLVSLQIGGKYEVHYD